MEIKNKEFFAEIKGTIAKIQFDKLEANPSTHKIAEYMYGMIMDYEEANESRNKLVRDIDVILYGEDGAAKQASLCDLVSPIREFKEKHDQLLKNQKTLLEAIGINNTIITEIYSHFGSQFDLIAKTNTEELIENNKTILSKLK